MHQKESKVRVLTCLLAATLVGACGGGGGDGGGSGGGAPLSLTNGQAAAVVVGQPNFVSNAPGGGAAGLDTPFTAAHVAGGNLYVSDYFNDRVLVFSGVPVANGASAAYALGQPNLTTVGGNGLTATTLNGPQSPMISGGRLFVAEPDNRRVSIYNTLPTASPGTIDVVLGQANKTSAAAACTATGLAIPETVWVAGSKIVVADALNHRVLIWNTIPSSDGQAADLVLGQANMTSCAANRGAAAAANTLSSVSAAWTDGTRLAVMDTANNRVLIWNDFPTSNGQAADRVLGQADFASVLANRGAAAAANTLNGPYEGVHVFNNQLFVADTLNHRVLIWNSFPTSNGQAADAVLGQVNFVSVASGLSATTLDRPVGVFVSGAQLFVSDQFNNRVLIFND